jgi:hypothetical protein
MILVGQVGNASECNLVPVAMNSFTPISGGGYPPYSLPLIFSSVSIAAPAPSMLPVPGKPELAPPWL